jgi:hypothetical protein
MGGAGVATADDTSAIDWNPAAVGFDTSWGLRIDGDVGVEFAPGTWDEIQAMVDQIQVLQSNYPDIDQTQAALENGTANESQLVEMLSFSVVEFASFQRFDLGGLIGADAGVKAHIKRLAFSGRVSGYLDGGFVANLQDLALSALGVDAQGRLDSVFSGGAIPFPSLYDPVGFPVEDALSNQLQAIMVAGGVDPTDANGMSDQLVYMTFHHIDSNTAADINDLQQQQMLVNLVQATVDGDAVVLDNDTGVHAMAAVIQEYSFASSIPIIPKKLSVGATAKMMVGTTYEGAASYVPGWSGSSPEDAINMLNDNIAANGEVTTNQIGLDLGILFRPMKMLSVGLTGKNINSPSFDLPVSPDPFVLKPQWRFGVAVRPASFVTVALDVDVTENRSQVATDYATRFYALGAEFSVLKFVQLRAGTYGNLLAEGGQPAFTVGAGVKIGKLFSFDVAGNISGDPSAAMNAISNPDTSNISDLPDAAGFSFSLQFNTRF